MKRCFCVLFLMLSLCAPAWAGGVGAALEREHKGIELIALPANPDKIFDTSLVSAAAGLQKLSEALDRLLERSPYAAQKLEILKKSGRVILVYRPDDAPRNDGGYENVAVFLPDFLDKPRDHGREKTFLVVIGRHGVKWPEDDLAAVLAHELIGHGMQHRRGRLTNIRVLDAECEASLYQEMAHQDLRLDKWAREMIEFRKSLEYVWCADFKRFMRARGADTAAMWDVLNPDIPKLLVFFDAYLNSSANDGTSAKSVAAAKKQVREKRHLRLRDAAPKRIYHAATKLRDGGIGVPQDRHEALRYFSIAADRGHSGARTALGEMFEYGRGTKIDYSRALRAYSEAAAQGHARAAYRLGWLYTRGRGVEKNLGRAAAWFRKSANWGMSAAQNRIGWLRLKGHGVGRDYAKATRWFEKAAKQKNTFAYFNLATIHRRGLGVPMDKVQAFMWYDLATANGNEAARKHRETIITEMTPTDLFEAKRRIRERLASRE